MCHLNKNPNKTYRNEGKGWIAVGTGVEKASQPRLNLSQALRSSILIDRSREEHKQRSEDEREQSGPALSKETTGT